ncbi:MAG: aldo/keto reductase [Sphaerochaetaceae bacterium]|nr:aldo/keto reductase [Sphaerochaetaceae bacterium]
MKHVSTITVPSSGAQIPSIGLGTFGSDHISPEQIAQSVRFAISAGYRHIDCASVYGNEAEIGKVFEEVFSSGEISREDVWITGKLWNDAHAPEHARKSFQKTLNDLRLDYLDLYLIHWPFRNHHPPHASVDSRSPNATPYRHDQFMETWRVLEEFSDSGHARHIGTSNMSIAKLELLLRDARIRPSVNEMELHPHFQQRKLFDFCKANEMAVIGYSPLGSPNRPDRDKTDLDTVDMDDPVIRRIAETHNVHPAAICLKWAVANQHVPIPLSTKEKNILSNLEAVMNDPLTAEEKKEIDQIDRNCRLIKGQVFLWEGADDYHDLWDEQGFIAQSY